MCLCSSTESEQKADCDGGGVFLVVIGMVPQHQDNERETEMMRVEGGHSFLVLSCFVVLACR